MAGKKFDTAIAEKEGEITAEREQMERIGDGLLKDIGAFAHSWFEKELEYLKSNRPEDLQALGPEKIAALRKDYEHLTKRTAEIVANTLGDDQIWPHRADISSGIDPIGFGNRSAFHMPHPRIPEPIDEPLRRVLGNFGAVLAEHGIQVDSYESKGSEYRYRYAITVPDNVQESLNEYARHHDAILEKLEVIKKLEKDKARAEVDELWKGN